MAINTAGKPWARPCSDCLETHSEAPGFPEMAKVGKMRGRRLGGQKAGGGLGHRRKPFTILPPWWSWIIMLGLSQLICSY